MKRTIFHCKEAGFKHKKAAFWKQKIIDLFLECYFFYGRGYFSTQKNIFFKDPFEVIFSMLKKLFFSFRK